MSGWLSRLFDTSAVPQDYTAPANQLGPLARQVMTNPVGTEQVGQQSLTNQRGGFDPVVDPSVARWPGRPMTQSEYDAVKGGSLDLFNQAALVAGSPAAEEGAAVGAIGRRPLPMEPAPPGAPTGGAPEAWSPPQPPAPAVVGDAPGGKALSGEILSAGDLWRHSPDELQTMLGEKAAADQQKLVQAFGSEDAAAEFTRLNRKQNSSVPRVADEGAREFTARFGNLTPEQERLAYGIGETDAQQEDIKEVLKAHNARASDPLDAAYDAAIAIRRAPAAEILAVPSGNGSPTAQAAYVRLMNAYQDMRTAGVPQTRSRTNDHERARAAWWLVPCKCDRSRGIVPTSDAKPRRFGWCRAAT